MNKRTVVSLVLVLIGLFALVLPAAAADSVLTVDLSGTWHKDITVQLRDGGTTLWSVNNQQGGVRTYNVAPGNYTVRLVQGPKILDVPVDCTTDCNVGDVTGTLTVDLSGTWHKDISVQLFVDDGGIIWSVNNQQGAVRTYNVLRNTYDLKLVQGPKVLDVADINCTADTCEAGDVTETLTVDLGGTWNKDISVQLYVDDGGIIWSVNNQQGAVRTYDVLKNTYDLKLVQGPKVLDVANINCASGAANCNAGDVTETLTLDLTGTWHKDISVQLFVDNGGIIWSVNNQHGAVRTYDVLKNTYDLKLVQGPKVLDVANINCASGAANCNAGDVTETLTVDLSGSWNKDITVQLFVDDGGIIWSVNNQHGAVRTYDVLKNTYDLKLVQGPKVLDVANIDCDGGSCNAGDVIGDLKVDLSGSWNKDISVQLKTNTGDIIWSVNNQHGAEKHYQVLKNTYDITLLQGPKWLTVDDVVCTGETCDAGDVTAQLSVVLNGFNGTLSVRKDDGVVGTSGPVIWSVNNQTGTPTYNVLKNHYDVVFTMGANSYLWDGVDCTGETCLLDKSSLIVKFPGITSVHTYVRQSDGVANSATGAQIASQTHKNNEAVFTNLPNGKYDVVVVKNAKTKIIDDVIVLGNAVVDDIVATLTVEFPGITSVHTYVRTDDGVVGTAAGGSVDSSTHKNDGTTLVVLKNTYDVVLVKNAKTKIIDEVDCTEDTCVVNDIVATLTVDFPGITSVHTYVRVNDNVVGTATGGEVDSRTHKNDGTTLVVLKNTYDVVLVKNAKTKIIDAVDCTGNTCAVNDIVATLTVNFPGITSVHTYVRVNDGVDGTAAGGEVDSSTHKNDGTTLVVLKNTYDVVLVKGAKTKIIDAVNCTGSTCVVDGIVATLTVKFPGISSVHTYVKVDDGNPNTATGGDVDSRTHKNDETSLVVLKNTYDVVLVKGAKTKIIDAVNCNGSTCLVEDIVATLTVDFPGMTGVHVYVRTNDGVAGTASGGSVDSKTNQSNSATLAVLKNYYDVVLVKGSNTYLWDAVNCTGNTCNLSQSTLTVKFPGISGVKVEVRHSDGQPGTVGGYVATKYNQDNEATFDDLDNGVYDIRLSRNSKVKVVDNVVVLGSNVVVDDLIANLTINFPGISGVKAEVRTDNGAASTVGGGVETKYNQNDQATFVVFKNSYDIRLTRNSKVKVVDSVDCTSGACTVDNLTANLTINFPGIFGVKAEVRTDDGLPDSVGGGVETKYNQDEQATFVVFKNTYDIRLTRNAKEKIVNGVDCTSGTCSVSNLTADMTVNFPGINGVKVEVRTNDGVDDSVGGGVETKYNQNGSATFVVFKNTYDVRLTRNSKEKIEDAVDCTGGSCTVGGLVTDLTVNFPGISGVKVEVRTDDGAVDSVGGGVETLYNQNGSASFVVFKNDYDIRLTRNAKEKIVDHVDCDPGPCTVIDLVTDLTVNFPGVNGVKVEVRTYDGESGTVGGGVETLYNQNGSASFVVFKNDYDIRLTRNAKVKVVDNVDCDPGSCTVNDLVATLTVDLGALTGVKVEVRTNDNVANSVGGGVETLYNQTGSINIPVLRNFYDLRFTQGSNVTIKDAVNCTGTTCNVSLP